MKGSSLQRETFGTLGGPSTLSTDSVLPRNRMKPALAAAQRSLLPGMQGNSASQMHRHGTPEITFRMCVGVLCCHFKIFSHFQLELRFRGYF